MMHVFIIFTNKCFAVSPAPILHVVQACWHVHVMRRGPELLKSGSVTCSLFNRSPHPGNYVDTNREMLVKGCLEEKNQRWRYYRAIYMLITLLTLFTLLTVDTDYPAHARSARARRACALRALGLLLADGAPTVGGGKTF